MPGGESEGGMETGFVQLEAHGTPFANSGTFKKVDDLGGRIVAQMTNRNQTESMCNIIISKNGCVFLDSNGTNGNRRDLAVKRAKNSCFCDHNSTKAICNTGINSP